MAELNKNRGTVIARCRGCNGANSSFDWESNGSQIGAIKYGPGHEYPGKYSVLEWFLPESKERLPLPKDVPPGIRSEFREAEKCLEQACYRAAAGLFRSVLEKTLAANGYKTSKEKHLVQQIDAAAVDGVITEARKNRAHEDIRVLGNDVLHDEWRVIPEKDVEDARHYAQRILEDFYDDREAVLALLRKAQRVSDEDKKIQNDGK